MRLKDVKDFFFKNVTEFNDTYGFVSKKTTFKLVKKTEFGSIVIHFTYNTFYDEVELIPCLKIYHKNITNIASKCIPGTNPAVAMYMIKLQIAKEKGERHIQKAAEEREIYWHIRQESYQDDIIEAIKEMTYIYEKYGKHEAERFSSLEEIYSVFSHKPKKDSYYHTVWPYKATFGLITAKVLKKRDYEKLKKIYYKEYKDNWGFTLDEFECLMDVLDNFETK